ncbi:MAG: transporter [Deltaproteobacteria bacterium]|nr:transporter [Deltaproteobacteria bacterium]
MELLNNPIFVLLAVILSGHLLGRIRLWSFSLGSSAIIFSGLALGLAGFNLPPVLQSLGLTLFIYAVGQQAGPGFLHSMKRGGLRLGLCALTMAAVGLAVTLGLAAGLDLSPDIAAGLFAGALTSTPSLAVAVEMAHDSQAPAAYGVAYPFGVIGAVLVIKFMPLMLRASIRVEEKRMEEELTRQHPGVDFTHLRVTNPNLCVGPLSHVLPEGMAGVTITRVLRHDARTPELATAECALGMGDTVRVVGTEDMLRQAEILIGPRVEADLAVGAGLAKREILLSRPEVAGKTLRALNLSHAYGVQVSRITRNGFDCPAGANVRVNQGDILHVVGHPDALENVKKLLGDDVRALYVVSVVVILAGLFCGMLFGAVPLYLPGLGVFSLGATGGVLLAGLGFGALRQIGPVITELPGTAIAMLRDLGLGLFLAVVGTKAGATLIPTLAQHGYPLFLAGAAITTCTALAGAAIGAFVLRIPFLRLTGVVAGGMTSTTGLDAAAALSPTTYAATAYATVYPAALIGKILATKIIMLLG